MIDELEAILRHSGIAAYLPAEVKAQICRSVAIDLHTHLEGKAAAKILSECEKGEWSGNDLVHAIERDIRRETAREIFGEIDTPDHKASGTYSSYSASTGEWSPSSWYVELKSRF